MGAGMGDPTWAETVILGWVTIGMVWYALREARRAWKERPPVVWDPSSQRWRAKRGTHRR